MTDIYEVRMICNNCGKKFKIHIDRDIRRKMKEKPRVYAEDKYIVCPDCGCNNCNKIPEDLK